MGIDMKKKSLPPSTQAAAVITGAGSGIGRSFAYEVARRGGSALCVEQVASNLRALGTHAIAQECDVGDEKQMASLAENAESLLGRPVTLVINNAGVGLGGPIGEVPLQDWHWCMNVNLWGVIHGCHFFAPSCAASDTEASSMWPPQPPSALPQR
jgi:NAD(P)-dependent dehydrogenase (short-subunit alcohol dehydrogenase family)